MNALIQQPMKLEYRPQNRFETMPCRHCNGTGSTWFDCCVFILGADMATWPYNSPVRCCSCGGLGYRLIPRADMQEQ
jgi:hypothetical protein